ncbi:MAG: hypothetical protein C0404_09095 [Verrucomicrobia bacterium]|nr:hypothetical protein [Verrucomicrobiota bacterium]
MGVMRFGWIADAINNQPDYRLHYELYRPFRSYDMLVFVKSMTPECLRLAETFRRSGGRVLFDINVNYFDVSGNFYYNGMKPTDAQVQDASAMAGGSDGVIAASTSIEESCRKFNPRTVCIPDNVNQVIVPARRARTSTGSPLRLLWSGQAMKLFDLLAIEEILRHFRRHIEVVIVTTDLKVLEMVFEPHRTRLRKLLADLECKTINFESIPRLLEIYAEGGVLVSPRFLDSSYNCGHTEWKITLGMACGRVAVCSPQRSYQEVSRLSGGTGIRVCDDRSAWCEVFDSMLSGRFDWASEEAAAARVVSEHYSTSVIAGRHAGFINSVLGAG